MSADNISSVRVADPVRVHEPLHVIVERIRVFLALLTLLITVASAGSAWVITKATGQISNKLDLVERRAVVDSIRFERAMEVVELVALAIVEETNTPARQTAIDELRHRRRITPR